MAPLVVIVGETASGKSALALELAKQFNGEIICADSRTVYKGMDIGTAKPSLEEQSSVVHHGLDVVEPDQKFSVADFKSLALAAIREAGTRDKLSIMVGGSGLYIDAVLYDFEFLPIAASSERERLNKLSIEELQAEVVAKKLPMPSNNRNPRHLQRAIETAGQPKSRQKLRSNTLILGLSVDREELRQRITKRVDTMVENGLVREISILSRRYGWEVEAMRAPAYKAFRGYMEGGTIEEAKQKFVQNDYRLAKKQRTWFKRNSGIQWLNDPRKAAPLVAKFLNKKQ